LTGGNIATILSAATDASSWFAGGIVAYQERVKFDLLGVDPGPVCNARCSRQMARAAGTLLGADATVATTGVGGPDSSEGLPAGTVFLAIWSRKELHDEELHLTGDPEEVVQQATSHALRMLRDAVAGLAR
jgi:nicotinamide-nucleotide amidase